MAYNITDSVVYRKPSIASTVSCASVGASAIRPGTVVKANDPTLGNGEFIYLPTVASVTTGLLVTFRQSASGVYTVAPVPNTANLAQPVAVAMAAGAANNYGWFQIEGTAPIKKSAVKVSPNVALFISSTTGRVQSAAASGKQVLGFRSSPSATVASATSTVYATFNRPHMQGQVI